MVKAVDFPDKLIFNYLGKDRTAITLAYTQCYLEEKTNTGNLWVQYAENGSVTAVMSVFENGRVLLFFGGNTDFEELSHIMNGGIITDCKLSLPLIDKKYLLHIKTEPKTPNKGIKYSRFGEIKELNPQILDDMSYKMYLNLKGCCEGCLIEEKGVKISGGFISFNSKVAVISDVFTKEEYRNKGYGGALVKKLLTLSSTEDVYLICEEHNLNFYEKIGFDKAAEIYEYEGKDKHNG